VGRHVDRFNAAVVSGQWSGVVAGFADDAVLSFVGIPGGQYRGRDEIAAAYESRPPDDTLTVRDSQSHRDVDTVAFDWAAGGSGTMRMRWEGDLLAELVVAFDDLGPRGGSRQPSRWSSTARPRGESR